MEKLSSPSSLSPYLSSNHLQRTPVGTQIDNSIYGESNSPGNIRSPSLSPYLAQAAGSPSSSCSSSSQSSSSSPSSRPTTPPAYQEESRQLQLSGEGSGGAESDRRGASRASLVSPLLCLASSRRRRLAPEPLACFIKDGLAEEEGEEAAAAACECQRLVELVEIHSTISRVVADSEEEGTGRADGEREIRSTLSLAHCRVATPHLLAFIANPRTCSKSSLSRTNKMTLQIDIGMTANFDTGQSCGSGGAKGRQKPRVGMARVRVMRGASDCASCATPCSTCARLSSQGKEGKVSA